VDTVSTGSGSDLVSDQHVIFSKIRHSDRSTRSLPLPVLTVSKDDFWTFEAKPRSAKVL
jgi:hypothetical protein